MEFFGINPLRKKKAEVIRMVMVTFAFGIIGKSSAEIVWGRRPLKADEIFDITNVSLGNNFFRVQGLVIILTTLIVIISLWYYLNKTMHGKGFRVSAFNPNMAYMCGINVRFMVVLSFILSGLLGGLAGALVGPIAFVSSHMGNMLGVKGFCAAVIGGMGNPVGAILGGLIIGLSENLVGGYISTRLMHGLSFFLLIIVLLLKPTGLLPKE
jgi:branched-chain amino acid transport system permease protein